MSGTQLTELRERAAALLSGNLKHVAAAGLAAALIPLGAVGAPTANAQSLGSPRVDSFVNTGSANGSGSGSGGGAGKLGLRYSYTVVNPAPEISPTGVLPGETGIDGWALPLFQEVDFIEFTTPAHWTYSIQPGSLWDSYYNPALDPKGSYDGVPASHFVNPVATLVFQTDGTGEGHVQIGESLGGFSFLVPLNNTSTKSPVMLNDAQTGPIIGDPDNPTAPVVRATGVPEPLSATMVALAGIAGAASLTRRRRA